MTVQKKVNHQQEIPPHLRDTLEEIGEEGIWNEGNIQPEPMVDDDEETMAEDPMADYRIEILGKAAHIVSQDRNVEYGPPEDSFARIANLWTAYLNVEFLPTDVAAMLALLKIARLASNPMSEDSYIDLAGYAAVGASLALTLSQQTESEEQ